MKIHSLMIPNPITITEKASIEEAINQMKINAIRHLPVISKSGKLKGMVTLADLKQGLIPSMLSDVSLSDIMIKKPITVVPDDDVETAAQLIYRHKISGIPVVQEGKLVGIITETDILRAFIDMMGILSATSRIDVAVDVESGEFNPVLKIINDNGGDVINVGMAGELEGKRIYYFRLTACKTKVIKKALEKEGYLVLDAMD